MPGLLGWGVVLCAGCYDPPVFAKPSCGRVDLLGDDFAGTVRAPVWGRYPIDDFTGTTVAQVGDLAVTPAAAMESFGAYFSQRRHDLRGGEISVEVTEVLTPAPMSVTYLVAAGPDGSQDQAGIAAVNGWLGCVWVAAGNEQQICPGVAYSSTAHRWWRLREQDGTAYWETSADPAGAWTSHASRPTPAWFQYALIEIGAGHHPAQSSPGTARFDNVNGGTASGSWCPAADFVDPFDGGIDPVRWAYRNVSACTVDDGTSDVSITAPAGTDPFDCWFGASAAYDLTDSSVTLEVTAVDTASTAASYLWVTDFGGTHMLVIRQERGMLYFDQDRTPVGTPVPWDATTHRYWRIAHDGGQIRFRTSGGMGSWQDHHSAAIGFPVDGVLVYFGVYANSAVLSPATSTFAGLNAP